MAELSIDITAGHRHPLANMQQLIVDPVIKTKGMVAFIEELCL